MKKNKKSKNEVEVTESTESVLDPMERRLLDLTLGIRQPENDYERRIVEQNKEIEKRGGMITIPSN